MKLTLHIWRQKNARDKGRMVTYQVGGIVEDMSFLEMLDVLNEQLITNNEEPVAFDHDCREGICGACALTVNGIPHGPEKETTICQLHMRHFKDGDTIYIEPFRARAFPVIKDLVVDRSAFDRIMAAGGFVSCRSTPTCRRVRPSASAAYSAWSRRWTRKASAAAPINTNAKPCVPRASAWRALH
jgi:succinate dehydrogenase / fumarate reductase, iron-sulfur subunit